MKKLFNIYGRKVNKGETRAFSYADLSMGDSGAMCEHGSAYFYFCITRTAFLSACVRVGRQTGLFSFQHVALCCVHCFYAQIKSLYADGV